MSSPIPFLDVKRCGHTANLRKHKWIKKQVSRYPRRPVLLICKSEICTSLVPWCYEDHRVRWIDSGYRERGFAHAMVRPKYEEGTIVVVCDSEAERILSLLRMRGHVDEPVVLRM